MNGRRQELFDAIHSTIVDLRIILKGEELTPDQIDLRLAQAVNIIWEKQCKVLAIKG